MGIYVCSKVSSPSVNGTVGKHPELQVSGKEGRLASLHILFITKFDS